MKIVLAYSGGLDTSVLLSWIKEKYDAEMIAFCANIGQEEELRGLEAKAKKTGASKIYIDDLQEEFARDFIYPDDPRRRDLRGPVFPRHQHRPAAHRQAHGGDRQKGKGRRHRPRRHRQGQRPGALRTHRRRARAGFAGHRPVAGRAVSQRISRPAGDD